MTDAAPFEPNWAIHPGATVADCLEEQGLSQVDAATRLGLSKKFVNDLIRGRAGIKPDTAHALSLVLGSTPAFWLRLQAQYEADRARHDAEGALAKRHTEWLKQFPVGHMTKLGWVDPANTVISKIKALLRFFGVADRDAWQSLYEKRATAFRTSKAHAAQLGATTAWLRRAELLAQAAEVRPFDLEGFRTLLPKLRALSRREDFLVAFEELREACAAVGVAVVFVPAPKGCRASGATFFLGERAVLALSGRHRTDDHLWFSFFHEAGHLVLHGRKLLVIEGLDTNDEAIEREADAFARDQLIPPDSAAKLPGLNSPAKIEAFARRLGVSTGIVVGRMQHDGLIHHAAYHALKRKLNWAHDEASEVADG